MFRFKCLTCSEWHEGMPGFSADAPLYFYYVPQEERQRRCQLTPDTCVVDGEEFFIRGCLEIPVIGVSDPFIWGVWVSLSSINFREFRHLLEENERDSFGPYFGWLSAAIKGYPETEGLKTRVHLRNNGTRPNIELEPTDHPLSVEQRTGITVERVGQICSTYMH